MDDVVQSVKSYTAFSKILVAVLCGSTGIFAVIDMEGSNLIFSKHLVKVCDYPIKIVDNIITTVMSMTGIKADTKPVFFLHAVIDSCQFFKIPSNLRTFSGHGFQCYHTVCIICQHFI